MKYSVISHPSRGFYVGAEYEPLAKGGYGWVPHFGRSTARDDRVERLHSQREIDRELDKMPEKLRKQCKIVPISV